MKQSARKILLAAGMLCLSLCLGLFVACTEGNPPSDTSPVTGGDPHAATAAAPVTDAPTEPVTDTPTEPSATEAPTEAVTEPVT